MSTDDTTGSEMDRIFLELGKHCTLANLLK
jgi:hypothetical protein